MARDTHVDSGQMMLVPGRFARHILAGSVAPALSNLIDQALERSAVEACFRHDQGGAPADAPAGLCTIVLLASSQGMVSSRAMETACREHVRCMAMAVDSQPHVTTLAECIRTLGEAIAKLCTPVLAVCDRQGWMGREMYATDGVKRPSHASKATSGARRECAREAVQMAAAVPKSRPRHRGPRRSQPSLIGAKRHTDGHTEPTALSRLTALTGLKPWRLHGMSIPKGVCLQLRQAALGHDHLELSEGGSRCALQ